MTYHRWIILILLLFLFRMAIGGLLMNMACQLDVCLNQPCRPLRGREMLYSFFEMTVTESDLDAKVLKIQ